MSEDTYEAFDINTPMTAFGKGAPAEAIIGRMLVIRQEPGANFVSQGYICCAWVNVDEPNTLRLELHQMMRFRPDPVEPKKGAWQYEAKSSRILELQNSNQNEGATSVVEDTQGNIHLRHGTQRLILAIMNPGANHPQPQDILPADRE